MDKRTKNIIIIVLVFYFFISSTITFKNEEKKVIINSIFDVIIYDIKYIEFIELEKY